MNEKDIRNWLGIYFLLITVILGGTILLLGESLLRLDDSIGVFEIIIPVLVGQLTIIFRWYTTDYEPNKKSRITLPAWIIKGPPLLVIGLLLITVALKVVGFQYDQPWTPSDEQFKAVVTFCVTILNATTIYVISKYFGAAQK
jgi:xanthine/uracil permease